MKFLKSFVLAATLFVTHSAQNFGAMSGVAEARTTAPAPACSVEDFLGGNTDSNSFRLSSNTVEKINSDDIGIELASSIVSSIAVKKGCKVGASASATIKFDYSKADCKEIVEGINSSEACFVPSDLGEFFVILDYLGGATIVFNRLD